MRYVLISVFVTFACVARSDPMGGDPAGDATTGGDVMGGDPAGDVTTSGDTAVCTSPAVAITSPSGGSDFATTTLSLSLSGICDTGAQVSSNVGTFADDDCSDGDWALQPWALVDEVTRFEITARAGACIGRAVQTAILLSALDRFRSVGDTAALASGATGMEISGNEATFATPLPARVGVGDVIEYEVDGGTAEPDALAFVHARIADNRLAVFALGMAAPAQATGMRWTIYRAYGSLADAVTGVENPSISVFLTNFDDWAGAPDLTTNGEVWNIACYGDRVDTVPVVTGAWTTSASNYLHIFTPVAPHHVGTSQRHAGTWGSGYALEVQNADGIFIEVDHLRIVGLQVWVSAVDSGNQKALEFSAPGLNCDFRVSHCILRGAGVVSPSWHCGFVVYQAGAGVARVSNTIAYDFDRDSGDIDNSNVGFECYDPDFTCYLHNNTAYGNRFGIGQWNGAPVIAKNNLSYANTENYFGVFEPNSTNNLAGPTGTAPGLSPRSDTTVTFRDDFHLDLLDQGARGGGDDLTNDANLPLVDDIDGDPRPVGAGWDIGADQTVD